jgi:hypothetical protein
MSRDRLVCSAVALLAGLLLVSCTPAPVGRDQRSVAGRAQPPAGRAGPVQPAEEPAAVRVLHHWDLRRSRAYARGSVPALRDLYVDRAGVADVRLLRAYAARGFRVTGMRMQLLAVAVLAQAPRRWRLRVTDRLDGAVAVAAGRRTVLPCDRASTRVVQLVRGADGRWRVASVREVSAAPRPAGRAPSGRRR